MKNNMELSLKNREWKEFLIKNVFIIKNSTPYHKTNLREVEKGIPYVSRTNKNNGLDAIVKDENFNKNKNNTIVFGAENATFFFQPFEYITGNKMYVIENERINKYSAKFIQTMLNQSIVNCGFGYGKGLTGTRLKNRYIKLPINAQGELDYEFMEAYMRVKEQEKTKVYKNYISKRIKELETVKPVVSLKEKDWAEFEINKIFQIKSGKRLTKANMKKGKKPFIGSTDNNNGITEYVSNTNSSEDFNVLGVNYNGSVVENFYHPYKALFSDDVKRLSFKEVEGNKYLYLFAKTSILKQKSKYQYGYKFNGKRMNRQKIMLPINENKEPDYDFMENYMKRLELEKIKKYLDYKEMK